jgi:undecaprenyl-diphosphatase
VNPDSILFHALNSFVGTVPMVDILAKAVVNDYAVPTIMALALAGIWFLDSESDEQKSNQRAVVITLIAFGLTLSIVKDIWNIYYRPRPFVTEDVKLLFYRPSVSSFPSLPIAVAFCFAAGVRLANTRLGACLLILAALFAAARVYAGVHYPLDVIAGAAIGDGCVHIVARLAFVSNPIADRVITLAKRFHYG